MGAQQGKVDQRQPSLTEAERSQLKILFNKIKSVQPQTPRSDICSTAGFQAFCSSSLDESLAGKIALRLSSTSDQSSISLNAFQQFIATILNGDVDERVEFIFNVCNGSGSRKPSAVKTVSGTSIMQYTKGLVESYKKSFKGAQTMKSWISCFPNDKSDDRLPLFLLQDLLYPAGLPKDFISRTEDLGSREFTLDEVITGLAKSVLFQNLSNSVFSHCFEFNVEVNIVKNVLPHCLKVQPSLLPSNFSVLDINQVIFLNSVLPSELRSKWRFLFSSAAHGESFSKCLNNIQDNGATVIIIKDDFGRIFGGFGPLSWKLGPKFFGTSESFLFHLWPRMASYSSTSYNENFQYLNIGQKTLPNGLGFGGKLEYFGLWIDSEFGKGVCSPSCTTYNCPQLSTEKEFKITHLEVWGVGPEPKKEEGVREPRSVLDKDPELRAVLEIMGKKAGASDGYRDIPDDTD